MKLSEIKEILTKIQTNFLSKPKCQALTSLKLQEVVGRGKISQREKSRINSRVYFDYFPEFNTYLYYKFYLEKKREFTLSLAVKEISTNKGKIYGLYSSSQRSSQFYILTAHSLDRICQRLNIEDRQQALLKIIEELLGGRLEILSCEKTSDDDSQSIFVKTEKLALLGNYSLIRGEDIEPDEEKFVIMIYTAITHSMMNDKQVVFCNVADKKLRENNSIFFFDNVKHMCFRIHSLEESKKIIANTKGQPFDREGLEQEIKDLKEVKNMKIKKEKLIGNKF